jgi:CHRD domain
MIIPISRRATILMACITGVAASVAPLQAAPLSFKVGLTGAQQVPPVQTAATGTADLTYDPTVRLLTWNVSYGGLSGPATMAHFHGPATAGKNGPPVIWLKEKGAAVESPIKGEATLTPEQAQQFTAGEWYINVHTQANPGGEIRGQVMPPKN